MARCQPPTTTSDRVRAGLALVVLSFAGATACKANTEQSMCTEEACSPGAEVELAPELSAPGEYELDVRIGERRETCGLTVSAVADGRLHGQDDCRLIDITGESVRGAPAVLSLGGQLVTMDSKPSDESPYVMLRLRQGAQTRGRVEGPLTITLHEHNGPGCGTCPRGVMLLKHDVH